MKKYNIALSVFFMALAAATFEGTQQLTAMESGLGPGSWPKVLSGILFVLGVILLLQSLWEHDQAETQAAPFNIRSVEFRRVLLGAAILTGFCLLLKFFGFIIAAAFMVPAVMRLMAEKRPIVLVGTTIGVLAAIYLIFVIALHLPLPQGSIF
ncbi:hypothetical protein SDC9_108417 [bioreactor metagenome]|uniref:DUF1468 domain-containing protein n=1 Tax=bioreactor metagenome TaxID=1076179 RepID=A0A645B828_9ZZZZ